MNRLAKANPSHNSLNPDEFDEETRRVLTAPPSWITRYGTGVIAIAVFTLLFISYFVKYPDIVRAEITISSYHTPAEIKARSAGRLNLLVGENELAKKGSVLGYISNTANYDDVKLVRELLLDPVVPSKPFDLYIRSFPQRLELGELERSYADFLTALSEYHIYRQLNSYAQSIEELNKQIDLHTLLEKKMQALRSISHDQFLAAEKNLKVDSVLHRQGVLSVVEFDKSLLNFLPYKKELEQIESSILTNKLRMTELTTQKQNLLSTNEERQTRLRSQLLAAYNTLSADIDAWKHRYLLESPIDGQVSFFKFWNNNQNVDVNETILTIVPDKNNVFGHILTGSYGAGKVKVGQTVNIRLHSYPYAEFGIIKGEVQKISSVPQNDQYAATIKLSRGLTTTHNLQLDFHEHMKGTAEIVTNDLRLIERFFIQLTKLTER